MRFQIVAAMLLARRAAPVRARREPIDRRVDRIEQQLRAVQRQVFPGGAAAAGEAARDNGASPVADLTARIDALEAQLARLTGQIEENGHRTAQMEAALARLRTESEARLARIETAAQPPAPAPAQASPAPAPAPAVAERQERQAPAPAPAPAPAARRAESAPPPEAAAPAADPAEEAYNAGFRLWEQRRYADAQRALEAAARRHSSSRWASWARNLAGRAYLDDGKPATAARVLLANYRENPRGERAADSLFFLGEALVRLDRKPEACRVYDELQEVYPTMRSWLRERLPDARRAAGCQLQAQGQSQAPARSVW